jgi:hypothetical protein
VRTAMITPRAVPALLPAHHRRVVSYQAITKMTLPTPCVRTQHCSKLPAHTAENPTPKEALTTIGASFGVSCKRITG